jgi:hypothetical protein
LTELFDKRPKEVFDFLFSGVSEVEVVVSKHTGISVATLFAILL